MGPMLVGCVGGLGGSSELASFLFSGPLPALVVTCESSLFLAPDLGWRLRFFQAHGVGFYSACVSSLL
jgi:hypothetical protein